MYRKQTVSIVFPAYNEAENITQAVTEFKRSPYVDEVIVINNNSQDQTSRLAKKAGALVVKETKQGYGFALMKGLATAHSDVIVLVEPDGTFTARDLQRLLKPLAKFDFVLGTRTNPKYISPAANMGPLLRYGNLVLAKVIQVLFQTSKLSDCGCTFRVFKREVAKSILPQLTVGGSHFLPQTLILAILQGFNFIEVPVQYQARVGLSKITGSRLKSIQVGWKMLQLVLQLRFGAKPYTPQFAKLPDSAE